jgi:molybdopterin converting factor small subunit
LETVKVKVKYFSFFENIAGVDEEYVLLKEPSLDALMSLLEQRYRAKSGNTSFSLKSSKTKMEFMVIVNGKLADFGCALKDNDEITFLQPTGGG